MRSTLPLNVACTVLPLPIGLNEPRLHAGQYPGMVGLDSSRLEIREIENNLIGHLVCALPRTKGYCSLEKRHEASAAALYTYVRLVRHDGRLFVELNRSLHIKAYPTACHNTKRAHLQPAACRPRSVFVHFTADHVRQRYTALLYRVGNIQSAWILTSWFIPTGSVCPVGYYSDLRPATSQRDTGLRATGRFLQVSANLGSD